MSSELQRLVIDGQTIWVEVDSSTRPASSGRHTTDGGKTVTTTAGGLALTTVAVALAQADIARTLTALITPVRAALAQVRAEEVSVELSLGLKGEVGVFVAKSEANAAIKITAKWKFGHASGAVATQEQQESAG